MSSPDSQSVESRLQAVLPRLVELRRELHRNPELSGREQETAQRIDGFLREFSPDHVVRQLGGTGLAAVYEGTAEGPTVLFRCELDALPIEELSEVPYRSQRSGVGHLCGHDGHMTIVAGLGTLLSHHRPRRGRIVLLFQPAEETGAGALQVLGDPAFEEIRPDTVFSLHNLPRHPLGTILVREGTFNCASRGLVARFRGRTSHAAWPEHGRSPALALAQCLTGLTRISEKKGELTGIPSLTVVHGNLGEEAFGTSPGEATCLATLRTETEEEMEKLVREVLLFVEKTASVERLECEIGWTDVFTSSANDGKATEVIRQAARRLQIPLLEMERPMRESEDFGQLTSRFPGAMFGVGSGESSPQLHNPDYDFPESLLGIGIRMFWEIAELISSPESQVRTP